MRELLDCGPVGAINLAVDDSEVSHTPPLIGRLFSEQALRNPSGHPLGEAVLFPHTGFQQL